MSPEIIDILIKKYFVVRKKNIFVLPVLMAWLIIFAHDVIPHSHHAPEHSCHNMQDLSQEHSTLPQNLILHEEAPEECCHFSVDILHEFSFDNEFIPPVLNYKFNCDIKLTNHYFKEYYPLIYDGVFLDQRQSRGPPRNIA